MLPDDPRHGEYAGAVAHYKSGEPPCDACRNAATRYQKVRKLRVLRGDALTVPIDGSRRRLQGLVHLGYGYAEIGRHLGAPREQVRRWASDESIKNLTIPVRDRIATVTRHLGERPPKPVTQAEKRAVTLARNLARRNGWQSLYVWDDIEEGVLDEIVMDKDISDPVIVDRILNADYKIAHTANRAERAEVVRRWRADGRSTNELARLTGWNVWRYLDAEGAA